MTDEAKRSVADGMEGWVIVPTEPTIAMIEAWEAAILDLIDAALAPFLPKESNPHG